MKNNTNPAGMGLISLLLAMVIIAVMTYFAFRSVQPKKDSSQENFLRNSGLDTSSYKGMIDSTKRVLKDAEAARSQNGF